MPERRTDKSLSRAERQEVFLALVEAQDRAMTVAQSRATVAGRFGVTEDAIRRIEREGLEAGWPPLA